LQINGPIFVSTGKYFSLTHSFGDNPWTTKFGRKKTKNIALSCGANSDYVSIRDCSPGIPGFPNPVIPEIFQSRNPEIEPHSIQGFRD